MFVMTGLSSLFSEGDCLLVERELDSMHTFQLSYQLVMKFCDIRALKTIKESLGSLQRTLQLPCQMLALPAVFLTMQAD